jgi:excisionase family DNA binding protein
VEGKPPMTVREVAERLRVRPETVRRWIAEGTVRAQKPGGNRAGWRVPVEEVERLERGQP